MRVIFPDTPTSERWSTDCRRLLGEEHPNTLNSANNLAGAYESAGRLEQPIPLYEQTSPTAGGCSATNRDRSRAPETWGPEVPPLADRRAARRWSRRARSSSAGSIVDKG